MSNLMGFCFWLWLWLWLGGVYGFLALAFGGSRFMARLGSNPGPAAAQRRGTRAHNLIK
jgi:hypothetical protein